MLAQLNPQQLEAVKYTASHLSVIAGPGTGKTKVLTTKVFYLLEAGVKPSEILALTFTKKSAAEMRERLIELSSYSSLPFIGTFHAFAHHLLIKRGLEKELIDPSQQFELAQQLKTNFQLKGVGAREILSLIALKKQGLNSKLPEWLNDVFSDYQQLLIEKKKLDFDDLLLRARDLSLKKFKNYKYILVDEFQDTNQLQYQFLLSLINHQTKLTIVGDPLQAIYGFRGSDKKIFDQFVKDFNPQEVVLTINYRNPQQTIDLSHDLFPNSVLLMAAQKSPGKNYLVKTFSEYTEADYVLSLIETKIGGLDLISSAKKEHQAGLDRQARFSDFAVMFRTHHFARALEKKFSESGIPFQKIGAASPLALPEIKLIITHLKKQSIEVSTSKVTVLIKKITKDLQLEKVFQQHSTKSKNFKELQSLLVRFDHQADGLKKAVEYLDYLETYDYYDERADKVTLLTMHAAKGLEFKHVYLCGFEEGIIPLTKEDKPTDLNEEKRLLYVAMTRAKEELFLFRAHERNHLLKDDSSFLTELDLNKLVQIEDPKNKQLLIKKEKMKLKNQQPSLF